VQVIAMMDYPSSQRLFALLPRIRALADRVLPPEVRLVPTGTSLLWANMDDGVIRTQKESLVIVGVVCFGILLLLFGSLGLSVLGLALSLYPVGMVLGLMGWWNVPVNMATVLIAGIAVGLAVDDTIHFVHAYQESRQRGEDRRAASEQATVSVGLRMVMTSIILIGAFASMGLSDFMPTAQFGLLSSLTIMLALVADLTLLPVMLSWRHRASARSPSTERESRALAGRSL
jgi:predicted RND superfamily exporter protein